MYKGIHRWVKAGAWKDSSLSNPFLCTWGNWGPRGKQTGAFQLPGPPPPGEPYPQRGMVVLCVVGQWVQLWAWHHSSRWDRTTDLPGSSGSLSSIFERDPVITSGQDPLTTVPPHDQGSTGTRNICLCSPPQRGPQSTLSWGKGREKCVCFICYSPSWTGGKTQIHILVCLCEKNHGGTWVAQSVKRPTSAQVMISGSVSSSPALGSVLMAQSLEPVSDSLCPSLSAPPPLTLCLRLKNKH